MNPSTNHGFSRLAASAKVSIDEDLLTILLDLLRQGVSPEALYSFLKKAESDSRVGKMLQKRASRENRESRNRKSRSQLIMGAPREEEKQV